jgi:hypothetical protein
VRVPGKHGIDIPRRSRMRAMNTIRTMVREVGTWDDIVEFRCNVDGGLESIA